MTNTCTLAELAWAVCVDPADVAVTIHQIDPFIDPTRIPAWMCGEVHDIHDGPGCYRSVQWNYPDVGFDRPPRGWTGDDL